MNRGFHALYIAGSVVAAAIAAAGMAAQLPALYGIVPGLIGFALFATAVVRFFLRHTDLAGFAAVTCGFVYYQAYQASPLMLPAFDGYILPIPLEDRIAGIVAANLTTALLLIGYVAVSRLAAGPIGWFAPRGAAAGRERIDGPIFAGFLLLFLLVLLPNALYGQVVVGPLRSIFYQRLSWDAEYAAYSVTGGALASSFANVTLWATSLYLVWLYLLGSAYRAVMWILSPLVVLWAASVALQGSRTYLVTLAIATAVYWLGHPRLGRRAFFLALGGGALVVVLLQISTLFRTTGLQSFRLNELTQHALELQGNEGATSEMDGIEYFRTELAARRLAPNPIVGAFRGMFERPVEGVLMVVPRSVWPWKPEDKSATEYNLFFENVRLGVNTDQVFLGASPGLIGRELIRYGAFGPVTLLLWLGAILGLADRLYAENSRIDFHRILAATLVAFFVAQSRDFVPFWFIPFLPAGVILLGTAAWARLKA